MPFVMHPLLLRLLLSSPPLPAEYSAVPAHSGCRIFNTALSQGACGSCAAFAVATAAAMRLCLREAVDFIPSPYRLFDCGGADCGAGMSLHLAAAVALYGLGDIDDSPRAYGLPCDYRPERALAGVLRRPRTLFDPQEIQRALHRHGPLPGIVHHRSRRHAIVVVGWGREHWTVQNSWSEDWGDRGRANISRAALHGAMDVGPTGVVGRLALAFALAAFGALAIMAQVALLVRNAARGEPETADA